MAATNNPETPQPEDGVIVKYTPGWRDTWRGSAEALKREGVIPPGFELPSGPFAATSFVAGQLRVSVSCVCDRRSGKATGEWVVQRVPVDILPGYGPIHAEAEAAETKLRALTFAQTEQGRRSSKCLTVARRDRAFQVLKRSLLRAK